MSENDIKYKGHNEHNVRLQELALLPSLYHDIQYGELTEPTPFSLYNCGLARQKGDWQQVTYGMEIRHIKCKEFTFIFNLLWLAIFENFTLS